MYHYLEKKLSLRIFVNLQFEREYITVAEYLQMHCILCQINKSFAFYKFLRLTFYVTTWNADEKTSSPGFATAICGALDSMRELVDQGGSKPSARL